MKRPRLMFVAVVCGAVAAAIGLAAVTVGPIAYSRVFRGVGDPHAPADRIKLNGRTYYLSTWPGPDTWESMLDYMRSEGTPLPDTRTMVRVGTPPWPDRAILVDPSMAGARPPTVIYVQMADGGYRQYGLSGGP